MPSRDDQTIEEYVKELEKEEEFIAWYNEHIGNYKEDKESEILDQIVSIED